MIRRATADDKPRLLEMAARFLLSTPYGALLRAGPSQIDDLIDRVLEAGAIVVYESTHSRDPGDSPQIIGMIALALIPQWNGELLADEIAWWVEPEYRAGRVGPALLRAGEAWARRNRANMLRMVAPAGSTVGAFYARFGYEAVEASFVKVF